MLKGSLDFIGVNYYMSIFARHESNRSKMYYIDNFDALAATTGKLIFLELHFNYMI